MRQCAVFCLALRVREGALEPWCVATRNSALSTVLIFYSYKFRAAAGSLPDFQGNMGKVSALTERFKGTPLIRKRAKDVDSLIPSI